MDIEPSLNSMQNYTLIFLAFALSAALFALQRLHDRLQRIEAKLNRLLTYQGINDDTLPEPSAEILVLAKAGKKVAAIKAYREQTGADFKAANCMIEKHQGK